MILNLEANGTVSLAGVRDMTVEVLDGRIWVTRKGSRVDVILARGARYSVEGEGVVLVGLDGRASLDLRAAGRAPWWRRLLCAWSRALEERPTACCATWA
jgi:hypothetical protein